MPEPLVCAGDLLLATGPLCSEANVDEEVTGIGWFVKQARFTTPDELLASLEPLLPEYTETAAAGRMLVACPGEGAKECDAFFAISIPATAKDGVPLVLVFRREGDRAGIVAVQLVPSGFYGAVAGGFANTGHPALDIPSHQWFIPWQGPPSP